MKQELKKNTPLYPENDGECEILSRITDSPLDPAELLKRANSPESGARVLFSGDVRGFNLGHEVHYLEYEAQAHLAEKIIVDILNDAREKWPLQSAFCVHRTGRIDPGEVAVMILTASAHRKDAYESNRYIIDRVKREAPIWKKECFIDGTHSWGGHPDAASKNTGQI